MRPWPWLVVAAALAVNELHIAEYAVDVPHLDEGELLRPDGITRELRWAWLAAPRNDHWIVLTKLLAWVSLQLGDLDFAALQVVGFGVYALGVALLAVMCRRAVPTMPAWLSAAFLLPLASALARENHLWAFQSQLHFG